MDYGKLKKDELVQLCEERGLSFSSSWTKDRLEELLIEDDNKTVQVQTVNATVVSSNETLIRTGTIINIVFGSIIFSLLMMGVIFIFPSMIQSDILLGFDATYLIPIIVFAIASIFPMCAIISNVRYKNGKDNRIMAGVLGLLFCCLIGGILVLVSKRPGSR